MAVKKYLVIFITGFIFFLSLPVVFAEDSKVDTDLSAAISSYQDFKKNEPSPQWAWGEVVSLDSEAKSITLKYLDYETDKEVELILTLDEKIVYENLKGFDQIKVGDTLSIDFVTEAEDKNVARSISLENSSVAPDSSLANFPGETKKERLVNGVKAITGQGSKLKDPVMDLTIPDVTLTDSGANEALVSEAKDLTPVSAVEAVNTVSESAPAAVAEQTQ